jgi:hypothetical protein
MAPIPIHSHPTRRYGIRIALLVDASRLFQCRGHPSCPGGAIASSVGQDGSRIAFQWISPLASSTGIPVIG